MILPSADGKFVLQGVARQWDGQFVHHVPIVVCHGRAIAAPPIEFTIQGHRPKGPFVLGHVHLEGDIGGWQVVAGSIAGPIVIVGGAARLSRAVGIPIEIRDRCAIGAVHHVIDQILLFRKTVDGVLVLHSSFKVLHGHTVHPIPVGVRHGVVDVVGAPTAPRASDKQVVKTRREARHIHIEGGLGQGTKGTAEGEGEGKEVFHEIGVLFVQFNVDGLVLHTQSKNAWFDDIA